MKMNDEIIMPSYKPSAAPLWLPVPGRIFQKTLARSISFVGVGVHTGEAVTLVINPAPADHGIVFVRTDLQGAEIRAVWDAAVDTTLCTCLTNAQGATVSTVEHLMAALRGCTIDNAIIEIDGPEVPIMDGSARDFVEAFQQVGTTLQKVPLQYIKVLKPIEVQQNNAYARLVPAHKPSYQMTFDAHGRLAQYRRTFSYQPHKDNFVDALACARTFGFFEDAEVLWTRGLAKGASLDNTLVVQRDGCVMNADGLRYDDEFVRHKILDAVGDMALADGHLIGHYEAFNSGHHLNNLLLRALYDDKSAWCTQSGEEYLAASAA